VLAGCVSRSKAWLADRRRASSVPVGEQSQQLLSLPAEAASGALVADLWGRYLQEVAAEMQVEE